MRETRTEQLNMFDVPKVDEIVLSSSVQIDDSIREVSNKFDYTFDGQSKTIVQIPEFPKDFQIGLIVGSSGSGKSTLLRKCFGEEDPVAWDNSKAIISNFPDAETGMELLCAT